MTELLTVGSEPPTEEPVPRRWPIAVALIGLLAAGVVGSQQVIASLDQESATVIEYALPDKCEEALDAADDYQAVAAEGIRVLMTTPRDMGSTYDVADDVYDPRTKYLKARQACDEALTSGPNDRD